MLTGSTESERRHPCRLFRRLPAGGPVQIGEVYQLRPLRAHESQLEQKRIWGQASNLYFGHR
jgi:hypothetical protein